MMYYGKVFNAVAAAAHRIMKKKTWQMGKYKKKTNNEAINKLSCFYFENFVYGITQKRNVLASHYLSC
jgi:hypothetical protein